MVGKPRARNQKKAPVDRPSPGLRPTEVWRPQPGPQTALLACPAFEVLYGGARGGGKTDGMLGEWAGHAGRYGGAAKGIFLRRELPQLEDAIARSKAMYAPLGAVWAEQKKTWTFPNRATLRFRALERDADAEKYQGHSYTRVYIEELTNFPDPRPVFKMKATLRSAERVPCRFRATGNPGGPGHHWVKLRYIDPAPGGYVPVADRDGELAVERVFIPARLADNPALTDSDPTYVLRLKQSGSAELVRAWLDGDWDVVEGAYFDCWRAERHVIRPVALPAHWLRFRSFDWGSARPFSVGWWAVASEAFTHPDGGVLPAGCLVRYREWYGARGANEGLKLHAEEVALGIASREAGEDIAYGVADPSIFAEDGGPSIAERMWRAARIQCRPADNRRVAGAGRAGGWDQLRARLIGEDGRAMIACFSTCVDSIRTLPALQHDAARPEDVDTQGEDHAADEWRYGCMSRPYAQPKPLPARPAVELRPPTLDELLDGHARREREIEPRI